MNLFSKEWLFIILGLFLFLVACSSNRNGTIPLKEEINSKDIELVVLGIAQDAGYPQANCKKDCCKKVWKDISARRMVSCLGLRDMSTKKCWLFDATPDFKDQLKLLSESYGCEYELAGVFLTHGHMGHYTGLTDLGREAMGAEAVPVYAMPRMQNYLTTNGPWSQLVSMNNIELNPLIDKVSLELTERIKVRPFVVPHRDEYTETVGYEISTYEQTVLFIPDIDKWAKWPEDIIEKIKSVDYAFLDGTFYRNGEIWGRDMSQIPHPFIEESIALLSGLPKEEKEKVHFIHLNHTNPLLRRESEESKAFSCQSFKIAEQGQVINLR